jgi:hypothetical protein
LASKEVNAAAKVKVEGADNIQVAVAGKVADSIKAADSVKAAANLRLAADTSPLTALLHIEAQLSRSEATTAAIPAAQFKHNAATRAAAVLVATKGKGVNRIATSKAIPKLHTFMLKAIVGSDMTGAGMTSVTIKTTYGNTDASAVKLAATTFIASKAETGTVSGSAAFTSASRRTTTVTPATGCGTATTSSCTTIQITLAGISLTTPVSALTPTCSISARRWCLEVDEHRIGSPHTRN